jgi:hypothetical protein
MTIAMIRHTKAVWQYARLEALRFDERSNGCLNWCGHALPSRNHALQISVKRRHEMTIETARMRRPCSAALLASAGSRNAIRDCVEFRQGFKSPILHSKPFARDRKWPFSLKLRRQLTLEGQGLRAPASKRIRIVSSPTQIEIWIAITTCRTTRFRAIFGRELEARTAENAAPVQR